MKILITNVHSARNSGDAVLLKVTLQEIAGQFPGAATTIALNDPDHLPLAGESAVPSFVHWFKSNTGERGAWRWPKLLIAPWLLGWALLVALLYRATGRSLAGLTPSPTQRRLLQSYLDADLVVSCPGNFFLSGSGVGLPLFLALFSFGYGWLAGKPLYMMQQTVGPFRRRWERLAVRWLFTRVRVLALRDEPSRQALRQAGLDVSQVQVLPDAAFLYRGAGSPQRLFEAMQPLATPQRPWIGLTAIDFGLQNRLFHGQPAYEEALVAALISFTRRHGGSVLLFPQVCGPSQAEDDRLPSRRIAGRLQAAGVTALAIDGPWTPDDLQCAYGQMDLFAGTRLHSNIFALTAGTPVVAIAYYYKTYGVMQTVGLSEWVLDIRTLQAAEFEQRLELLWQQRAAVRDHLRRTLPLIQQQARRAAQRIRADFTEWSQP
jgi:colanic acid/amylovoran biosynthesis protein